jgi:hypothetical protein
MRTKKFYTVKQWSKFKSNDYFDMQEMLCQRYDVVLIDYKTRKEKIISVLKKFNQKNFDKSMTQFGDFMKDFGNFMDQLTREIDTPKQKGSRYKKVASRRKNRDHLDLVWRQPNNSVPIWGTSEDNCDSQSQHKANLEKIWGKNHD